MLQLSCGKMGEEGEGCRSVPSIWAPNQRRPIRRRRPQKTGRGVCALERSTAAARDYNLNLPPLISDERPTRGDAADG